METWETSPRVEIVCPRAVQAPVSRCVQVGSLPKAATWAKAVILTPGRYLAMSKAPLVVMSGNPSPIMHYLLLVGRGQDGVKHPPVPRTPHNTELPGCQHCPE